MASGWNLWVWLECIGVVSGCCKEVYRFNEVTHAHTATATPRVTPARHTCTSNVFYT